MVRTYVKKTTRTFNPDAIARAVNLVETGMTIHKAAVTENLHPETFRRHYKKHKKAIVGGEEYTPTQRFGSQQIFNSDLEDKLCDYLIKCSELGHGLSKKQCCEIAFKTAVHNNLPMPESWKLNKMAGMDWLAGFFKRHPNLSVRRPESCSLARASAFNPHTVSTFFNNLSEARSRHPSFQDGSRLFNLDEVGAQTVQKKPPKIIAEKGKKQVYQNTSAERGTLVTRGSPNKAIF